MKKIIILLLCSAVFCGGYCAEWKLDEGRGQDIGDTRGELKGFLGEQPEEDSADARWQADGGASVLLCDGVRGHATISHSPYFDFSGDSECMVQIDVKPLRLLKPPFRAQLMTKGPDSARYSWQLYYLRERGMKSGRLVFRMSVDGKTVQCAADAELPLYQWSTAAVTLDGQKITLYLNGKALNSEPCADLLPLNAAKLKIGAYAFDYKLNFPGMFRNLKIGRKISEPGVSAAIPEKVLLRNQFAGEWQAVGGKWEISDNRVREFSDNEHASSWLATRKTDWAEGYTFRASVTAADNLGSILLAFSRTDEKNHYLLEHRITDAGTAFLKLYKVVNGEQALLGNADSTAIEFSGGKILNFEINRYRDLIVVSLNDRDYLSIRDTTFAGGGAALGARGRKITCESAEIIHYPGYTPVTPPRQVKPLELTIESPDFRHAFFRDESIALNLRIDNRRGEALNAGTLTLKLDNGLGTVRKIDFPAVAAESSCRIAVALEPLAWRNGDYRLTAETGEAALTAEYPLYIRRRPAADRYKLWNWGNNTDESFLLQLKKNGFNGSSANVSFRSDFQDDLRKLAQGCDVAVRHDLDLNIHFDVSRGTPPGRTDMLVRRADETPGSLLNPHHPDARTYVLKRTAELMEMIKRYPAFRGILLSSENENNMEMSFRPEDLERARRELGFAPPSPDNREMLIDGVPGRVIRVPQAEKESTPAVFPDDNHWFRFMKWFWQRGFGDNLLNAEAARIIKEHAPYIQTTHDPFRDVPVFHRNTGLDCYGTWFYNHPDAGETFMAVEAMLAAVRGGGGTQGLRGGPSLWLYSGQIGPSADRWAGVQPSSIYMESMWLFLASRPAAYELYDVSFLLPGSTPEFRPADMLPRLKDFSEQVVRPLWPAIQCLERPRNQSAMLLSMGSQTFDRQIWSGYGRAPANAFLNLLWKAHIPTDVVFEESIRDGDLKNYRLLFINGINYLPQSVFDKIVEFAGAGGIVVGDTPLAGRIPNARKFDGDCDKITKSSHYLITRKQGFSADVVYGEQQKYASLLNREFGGVVQPFAVSPSLEIYLRCLEYPGTRFVFAVNDRRTFGDYFGKTHRAVYDQGLPLETDIELNTAQAAVYLLPDGKRLPVTGGNGKCTVHVSLPPADGKILAVYERAVKSLQITAPENFTAGQAVQFQVAVLDGENRKLNGVQPLKIDIFTPDGQPCDFSDYAAAVNGAASVPFIPAVNDPRGAWKIKVAELASGISAELDFRR